MDQIGGLQMETILIIDDEAGLLEMLNILLVKEGFTQIKLAQTGQTALNIVKETKIDLIILDVMLPDMNGFELCLKFRALTACPILFLTARTSDYDLLQGFGMGGDDYVTKPFNALELVARVNAQLRRKRAYIQESTSLHETVSFQHFTVNRMDCQVYRNGLPIELTAKEYHLIQFLIQHPNRIFSIEHLYEQVWDQPFYGDEKTVVIYISKLRHKLEPDPKKPIYLINVRGLGYKFVPHAVKEQRI
ncbi:DNA-binding response regulator [Paenibacillus sp. FSL H7-0331]|nr:DNA-binding response regulator [Paenibacillus sp. FSL H7-0331]